MRAHPLLVAREFERDAFVTAGDRDGRHGLVPRRRDAAHEHGVDLQQKEASVTGVEGTMGHKRWRRTSDLNCLSGDVAVGVPPPS
jgi:pyruvate/2-oxoglutarate dehydrogenase complex dihydrolipoamide acyltransferase (E2) component